LSGENATTETCIGWYAYLAGKYTEAIAASRKALELDANAINAALNLGLTQLRSGHPDEAAQAYTDALLIADRIQMAAAIEACRGAAQDLKDLHTTGLADNRIVEAELSRIEAKLNTFTALRSVSEQNP